MVNGGSVVVVEVTGTVARFGTDVEVVVVVTAVIVVVVVVVVGGAVVEEAESTGS